MPVVKTFQPSMLSEAALLFVSTFNHEPWNDSWTVETARTRLGDILATPRAVAVVVGASEPEAMLGFALGNLEQADLALELHVREMCVRPDRQRQGFGRALLAGLHEHAAAAGAKRAYLQTASGGRAESFYTGGGYRAAFRQRVFVKDVL